MAGLDKVMQHIVDVSVFDNHAKHILEDGFAIGKMFVKSGF